MVKNRRLISCAFLWGIPVAASFVLGWRLDRKGTVFGGGSASALLGSFLLFLIESVCLSVPAAALAAFFLRGKKCGNNGKKKELCEEEMEEQKRRPAWQVWIFYGAVIFLCWLPVFLAYYPSVFAYDAEGQLYQVIADDFSTHHPLLHTLFLGAFFRLGGGLGSYSAGMAVHSVVQMILMAAAFGWALSYLYQKRIGRWVRIVLLVFYGFFPANSILALSTTKDVLFSALVLIHTVCLYRMVCDHGMRMGRKERAVYIVFSVLMLLFRNNAGYAFAVSVPVVWFGVGRIKPDAEIRSADQIQSTGTGERKPGNGGRFRKMYLCMILIIFVLFVGGSFLLKNVTHAQNGSPREMLSVPLQQMARTRVMAEEKLEPAMRQELDTYISSEWVFAAYNPHLADPVKNRAVIHDNPKGLIQTWIKLGLQHPTIYIDAFLDNSLGLWFLQDTSHAQIYGIGTESGFGYLSTDNRTMPAGCEIVEHSLLPGLRAFMEKMISDNAYRKIPVVRILFAPALYWWLLYFYIVAALYKKRYREILPVVFPVAYYLTLLLSPAVLVRYMYPIMATIPVILPCIMMEKPTTKSENIQ